MQSARRGAHPYIAALVGMLPAIAGAACDWSQPGRAPYRAAGDPTVASAVSSYTDIPAAAQADLVARIRGQREDALLLITRDGLHSPQGRATRLHDMHWRDGLCRGDVLRTSWPADRVEAALVYCSGPWCLAVPTVCGNVSRVSFEPHAVRERDATHWGGAPGVRHQVPEPGTAFLVALAGAGAFCARRARLPGGLQ